ncbi:hypothetical protein D9756_006438 [Leucocoprinus leucothites]|uniref:Nephrocystin 3-like N-terminal domain-containing protein n=1 Tax=Leucocoprinus leucothites TaxID=201217 RepID=A0A8H5G2L9_9AGAR|nr:hypothetical protein D9756_006438 [Leucoagaricus leucothites]
MSMFNEAQGVAINGGKFINNPTTYNQSGPTGIDILYEASTPEASVDAKERSYAPSCYAGTREQYIVDITNWATAKNEDGAIPPLYWMKGPAAVGKSAIAQTCAEHLKISGNLAAAFFFSVNGRRKDHTRFFPTLAYQLSTILPDYREILNRKIFVDRTLVKKTMPSQFRSLIVEPLQELRELGKDVRRRAIFVDGLDECQSTSAQMEIIEIIASSIRAGSTPFRWAVFSREESHIISAFASFTESSLCHSVLLSISRRADGEIELYLRGGFENILRRRNLLHLSSSWPTGEQIQRLVNAAAGLFAHPATVLRFVDRHSYSGFEGTLEAVLNPIAQHGPQSSSAYAELDALYTLILQRVPSNILSSMQLFFSQMVHDDSVVGTQWFLAGLCNGVGISEGTLRGIYHHLQAVIDCREYPPLTLDGTINLERSYFDHDLPSASKSSLNRTLSRVHGAIVFRHKSFYDFLRDPTRSSSFCVSTPATHQNLFDCFMRQHHHYASSYVVQGTKLVLKPGMASSSSSLSWPRGSEYVDSYLKMFAFFSISLSLSHDSPWLRTFLEVVPSRSLQKLAELDYRKCLLGYIMLNGIGVFSKSCLIGLSKAGISIINEGSELIQLKDYNKFDPEIFLAMVERLERVGIIRSYHPQFGSSRVASILHAVSRQRLSGKNFGLYKLGHGDRSVIWYWEFDTEKRYFHEFRTVNYEETMAFYKAEKFTMWDFDELQHRRAVKDKHRDGREVTEQQKGRSDDKDGLDDSVIPLAMV